MDFESIYGEEVLLAKALELRWFAHYNESKAQEEAQAQDLGPTKANTKNTKSKTNDKSNRAQHHMPFLRRTLCYNMKSYDEKSIQNYKTDYNSVQNANEPSNDTNMEMQIDDPFDCDTEEEQNRPPKNVSSVDSQSDTKNQQMNKNLVEGSSYDPSQMGPPIMHKAAFTLFAKHYRKLARQQLPSSKRNDKIEVRKVIRELWRKISSAELDIWRMKEKQDKERYLQERRIYFQSLSHVYNRGLQSWTSLSASSNDDDKAKTTDFKPQPTSFTQLKREQKPTGKTSVTYYYCFTNSNNYPVIHVEKRRDRRCPICFLNGSTNEGLVKHLLVTHSGFSFKCAQDKKQNLHITVSREPEEYLKPASSEKEHLVNFFFKRQKNNSVTNNDASCSQIPPLKKFPSFDNVRKSTSDLNNGNSKRKKAVSVSSAVKNNSDGSGKEKNNNQSKQQNNQEEDGIVPIRQYYHSKTSLPMKQIPNVSNFEWHIDSDDDSDDEWITQTRTELMNEFEDVSRDEKKFMLLWNSFMKSHTLTPDRLISQKLLDFITTHKDELKSNNLRQCLLLHLFNMWDSGIVSSDFILIGMQEYDKK